MNSFKKKAHFIQYADESVIHKEEIVDFLANYVEDEISIYYGLINSNILFQMILIN